MYNRALHKSAPTFEVRWINQFIANNCPRNWRTQELIFANSSFRTLFSQLLFPLPVNNPEWTPWLSHMSSSNIYGQLVSMYNRVEAFQNGMELLSLHCHREIQRLELGKSQLLDKVQHVRDAMSVLKKRHDESKKISKEHTDLSKEITDGLKYTQVRHFVDRETRFSSFGWRHVSSRLSNRSPQTTPHPLTWRESVSGDVDVGGSL
jgi:hypothetical protein